MYLPESSDFVWQRLIEPGSPLLWLAQRRYCRIQLRRCRAPPRILHVVRQERVKVTAHVGVVLGPPLRLLATLTKTQVVTAQIAVCRLPLVNEQARIFERFQLAGLALWLCVYGALAHRLGLGLRLASGPLLRPLRARATA
jgi:hypothetical protein